MIHLEQVLLERIASPTDAASRRPNPTHRNPNIAALPQDQLTVVEEFFPEIIQRPSALDTPEVVGTVNVGNGAAPANVVLHEA